MTAPDKIWLDPECVKDTDGEYDQCWHSQEPDNCDDCGTPPTEYTRTSIAQAAVAAAYEAAAQAVGWEAYVADTSPQYLSDWQRGLVAGQQAMSKAIRALATPDQIAALAAERAATVTVKPLVWVQSHLTSWNDDWHTIPTAYTIRCCDENGWKWQGNGGHGYESSAKHAMTAVQGIHEAAIRSAVTITSGASPDTITLPRAEVEDVADTLNLVADWMERSVKDRRIIGPEFHVPTLRKALATLQERMK